MIARDSSEELIAPAGAYAPSTPVDGDNLCTQVLRPNSNGRNPTALEVDLKWPHVPGYEILSEIGSGAMGVVYRAQHLDLRRIVALKMLRGSALSDPYFRDRFQAEAEAVARLQHPNIVQVFEFGAAAAFAGEQYPCLFIALEYVGGGSLAQRIGKAKDLRHVAAIVEKLARATHYAHRQGIIHRDLKPSNVLMSQDDDPKIADFGVAKQLADDDSPGRCQTMAGMLMGTPEYMAPEQLAGELPSASIDIYALGVILYELLTGRVPFQGATSVETLDLVRHQEPVPPRQVQPSLSADLDTICLKCLEKQPALRYPTALDLADDLRRFLNDMPIQARPVSDWERCGRWCRRNPGLALSTSGIVAVFVLAFMLVTLSYLRAEQARKLSAFQTRQAQLNERSERWERYRANLGATASAIQLHNIGSALQSLEAAPPEYRNWEWNHFHSRLDSSQHVLSVCEPHAMRGEISRDGSRVFMYSDAAGASLWDLAKRTRVKSFEGPRSIFVARISPDGKFLVYSPDKSSAVLMEIETNRIIATLPNHDKPLYTLMFTADSNRLITCASDNKICTWDTQSGKLLNTSAPTNETIDGLSCSDDGQIVAVTTVKRHDPIVLDLANGKPLPAWQGHEKRIGKIVFNHQGDRALTTGTYPDLTLRLWEPRTGKLLNTIHGHTNGMTNIRFSPDGTRLATGSMDQTICLMDGRSGRIIASLKGHSGWVNDVAFSPDNKRLVSCSQDCSVRLWDATTGDPLTILHGHTEEVFGVAFSADGQKIITTAADGTTRLWDAQFVERNGVLRGHTSFAYSVSVHPDGERVASAGWDGSARIWSMTTGREIRSLDHGKGAIVTSVAFHPNGKWLATRSRDAVRIWDVDSSQELFRFAVPSDGWRDTRLAFSPDGRLLASGCANRELRVWNLDTRQELGILRGHGDEIRDVAFSPDGKFLASAGERDDRTVRIWNVETMSLVRTLHGHGFGVYAVAFRPDSTMLASAGLDGSIRFWDFATGNEIAEIKLGSNIYGLAFTPDGSRVVGACADNVIRFWDTTTFQIVAELRGHEAYVHAVAFSPDGSRLASASGDYTVRIWDTKRIRDRLEYQVNRDAQSSERSANRPN